MKWTEQGDSTSKVIQERRTEANKYAKQSKHAGFDMNCLARGETVAVQAIRSGRRTKNNCFFHEENMV